MLPHRWAYFYDPTGEKARAVKRRYVGICRGCGAYTQSRTGKETDLRTARLGRLAIAIGSLVRLNNHSLTATSRPQSTPPGTGTSAPPIAPATASDEVQLLFGSRHQSPRAHSERERAVGLPEGDLEAGVGPAVLALKRSGLTT